MPCPFFAFFPLGEHHGKKMKQKILHWVKTWDNALRRQCSQCGSFPQLSPLWALTLGGPSLGHYPTQKLGWFTKVYPNDLYRERGNKQVLSNNSDVLKVTLLDPVFGPPSPLNPSFSGIRKVRIFIRSQYKMLKLKYEMLNLSI
jgi:hypothetical protein